MCNVETLKNTLEQYGIAIIPSVLNENECNNMFNEVWSFFEYITSEWETPLKRNDKTTWNQFYKLQPLHSMLIQHWGVGHCQASWNLRQNEKIVDIFARLWNCTKEDLLVSFDGLSFNLPPEDTGKGWNRNNTWYHVDQSYVKSGFECIQSWITAFDVNKGDATLSVYEKSHNYHQECGNNFGITDKLDWYKLNKDQLQFYINKGCKKINIECPKGSLVLWDSRMVHCGIEAQQTRPNPNFRCVVYLCYMPKSKSNKTNLDKKKKAFEELRTTSHWPAKIKLFPKKPRVYGDPNLLLPEVKQIEHPHLSLLGLKLAGL